jgi:hypothetical protein
MPAERAVAAMEAAVARADAVMAAAARVREGVEMEAVAMVREGVEMEAAAMAMAAAAMGAARAETDASCSSRCGMRSTRAVYRRSQTQLDRYWDP